MKEEKPMTSKSAIAINSLLLALLCAAPTLPASAQTAPSSSALPDPNSWPVHTFYLKNSDGQNTLNDDEGVLRNMFQTHGTEIHALDSQNAIVVRANPSDIATIETILNDIDVPKKTYRVTYTLTEMDGGKRVGTQHFATVMVSGQQTTLKQGSKVPVATGTYSGGGSGPLQTQFTYVDVNIDIDGTLQEMGTTGMLRYSIDQANLAPDTAAIGGTQQAILRNTTLKGETILTPGKPLMLGSLDFPGSTRRVDIEALMEPLP
jgi:type II secretory pathway component GspD/PulD (secretin)